MLKKCTSCGKEKEDNFKNFTKKNNGETACMCKECKSEYDKLYRLKNKEKISNYKKQYGKDNAEKISTRNKKWRERNKEHIKEYRIENKEKRSEQYKMWRMENREYCIQRKKEWAEINKEHIKEYRKQNRERDRETFRIYYNSEKGNIISRTRTNRRRAKKKELENNFSSSEWSLCMKYFKHRCAYCGRKVKLEQEHFISLNKNGKFTKHNILPSCRSCNASKGDKDFNEWYEKSDIFSKERLKEIYSYFKKVQDEI
ncbi:HNH endonuclease signature motif containing protein [Clostridium sp.]|uniref:HNH endonuclease n=1 Tax=Clostridium sp. TaxID=1506 RepID=UPI0032174E59